MLPNFKSFKNGKQFLVMCVILQLHCSKSVGVKGDWMDFIFFIYNGKNYGKNIVQSISFHNELSIGNPMSENGSGGKCFLESVESITTGGVRLPENVLPGEACQWNNNVQVVEDELAIEICKI